MRQRSENWNDWFFFGFRWGRCVCVCVCVCVTRLDTKRKEENTKRSEENCFLSPFCLSFRTPSLLVRTAKGKKEKKTHRGTKKKNQVEIQLNWRGGSHWQGREPRKKKRKTKKNDRGTKKKQKKRREGRNRVKSWLKIRPANKKKTDEMRKKKRVIKRKERERERRKTGGAR